MATKAKTDQHPESTPASTPSDPGEATLAFFRRQAADDAARLEAERRATEKRNAERAAKAAEAAERARKAREEAARAEAERLAAEAAARENERIALKRHETQRCVEVYPTIKAASLAVHALDEMIRANRLPFIWNRETLDAFMSTLDSKLATCAQSIRSGIPNLGI